MLQFSSGRRIVSDLTCNHVSYFINGLFLTTVGHCSCQVKFKISMFGIQTFASLKVKKY